MLGIFDLIKAKPVSGIKIPGVFKDDKWQRTGIKHLVRVMLSPEKNL